MFVKYILIDKIFWDRIKLSGKIMLRRISNIWQFYHLSMKSVEVNFETYHVSPWSACNLYAFTFMFLPVRFTCWSRICLCLLQTELQKNKPVIYEENHNLVALATPVPVKQQNGLLIDDSIEPVTRGNTTPSIFCWNSFW